MNKYSFLNEKLDPLKIGMIIFVLLFLSSLVVGKYIGKSYEHVFLLIGFLFVFYTNSKGIIFSKIEERLILFGVLSYFLGASGFFVQNYDLTRFSSAMEVLLNALIPLVLFSILYVLKVRRVDILVFGVLIAVWVASIVTGIGVFQSLPRGGGTLHGSPIIFGDLAMLFGILTIVFSSLYYRTKWFYLLLLTGVLGITSSLLSGTKGGWIVLITLPFFLAPQVPKKSRYKALLVFMVLIVVTMLFVVFTENVVKTRMLSAYAEAQVILFNNDYSGGSLGARLLLWKASLMAFLSSPLVGIGVGEFYAFKNELVNLGEIPQSLATFKHSHNDYLSILSSYGLIGVVFYAVFFVWLWKTFMKAMYSDTQEIKIMGVAGISTIICYLDFSLSESFLSSRLGGAAFYFIMTFFIYFIHTYKKPPE